MRTVLKASLAAIAVGLLVSGGGLAAPSLPARSSSQAGVTVKVTPRDLDVLPWTFDVVFDTHTQPLVDDLAKSAVLVPDGGAPHQPLKWEGEPPGGHHRKGVLQFKAISPLPAAIELRILRGGESAPRSFRWQLK